MAAEAHVPWMFQNEETLLFHYPRTENKVWYLLQPWKSIRRISKNNVILYRASFKICQHINMYCFYIVDIQIFNYPTDPGDMSLIHFNKMNLTRSPRRKFIADTPCAWKEIKHADLFITDPVVKYVKQALTGKVCCGSGLKTGRRRDSPPFIFAPYYSQFVALKRLIYLWSSTSLKT